MVMRRWFSLALTSSLWVSKSLIFSPISLTAALAVSAASFSPLAMSAPMFFEAVLRSDWRTCLSVSIFLRDSSLTRTWSISVCASPPRVVSLVLMSSAFSRMSLMSSMALIDEGLFS